MNNVRHLAQLNIGRFRYPTDDPRMADFMNNLDLVNGLAERSKGFVWRLKDDSNNATNFRPFDDPNMAVNLSVWESPKALEEFVFKTVHARFYKQRGDWFVKMDTPHMVFWWVEEGHRPTLDEAHRRLMHYTKNGPSDHAFGWAEVMDIERWRSQRCA